MTCLIRHDKFGELNGISDGQVEGKGREEKESLPCR